MSRQEGEYAFDQADETGSDSRIRGSGSLHGLHSVCEIAMFHTIHMVLGVVGSGESSSPLSAESSLSELLRLVQYLMAGAILYLIKLLKDTKSTSGETHTEIQTEIAEVRKLAKTNFDTNNKMIEEVKEMVERLTVK